MNPMPAARIRPPPRLDALLRRRETRDERDGIVLLGSLARHRGHPASDGNLLIMLADSPLLVRSGSAMADGQLIDLVCATVAAVESLGTADE